MLIDSHCHLDFPEFADDRATVIERARAAGIGLMLTISCKLSTRAEILALAEQYDELVCSLGIHPHEAGREPPISADELSAMAQHPKVVGIGETGLDYYYEHSPRDSQKRNFQEHIRAARHTDLPLIVHTRDADDDTMQMLEAEYAHAPFRGLIHCFTASAELAERALAMGFYISISGIATFKSAQSLRDIIKTIPLSRLLVETDAPFLAPAPHRGQRNEPAFVRHTANMVAEIKGCAPAEIDRATSENFYRLFTKAPAMDMRAVDAAL